MVQLSSPATAGASVERSPVDDGSYAGIEAFRTRMSTRTDVCDLPAAERDAVLAFVLREARLLDMRRYDQWIALCDEDVLYWVPSMRAEHRLAHSAAINFDDRRRLLDRIAFVETGAPCAQIPRSNTCRMLANVEAWRASAEIVEVRANLTLWEHRHRTVCFVGTQSFQLRPRAGGYSIKTKLIDLLDASEPQGNNSFII
ncbi:aromatic-ring-hydroxylating dioxygenase subunit beta [Paraburkholderia sp.]|uniref:aromatic-ring-hydroxylating dioxygenase subunit beta n=1 Tax=Paraburkholderia sp. TaxID=1926495 RepID=UPI0039E22305